MDSLSLSSDEGKLFIGGISWETSEEKLIEYFGNYGDISQTVIMRDKTSGKPRVFGCVVFSDPSVLDNVLQQKHSIDGRTVEAKAGNGSGGRSSGGQDPKMAMLEEIQKTMFKGVFVDKDLFVKVRSFRLKHEALER